jgi:hypothetical protein
MIRWTFLRAVALTACMLWLHACTNLQVHKIDSAAQTPLEAGSIPYALPKKTFIVSATYVLNACETVIDSKGATLVMDVETTIAVVPVNEVDEQERYYIPYAQLRSFFKEINYTVESHANQTLKAFNANITDQAGPILTAAIGTAIKILALGQAGGEKETEYCDTNTATALAAVAASKKTFKATPKPSDAITAEQVKAIAKHTSETLTSKLVLTWTPQLSDLKPWIAGRSAATTELRPGPAIGKWLSDDGKTWLAANAGRIPATSIVIDMPTWAHARLDTAAVNAGSGPLSSVIEGLVVREPAVGTLRVCKGRCPMPQDGIVSVNDVLFVSSVAVPQLGRKLVLPVRNAFLQTSVLDVAMSEDGAITKLGVKNGSTAAATIGALGGNADAARTTVEAQEKAKAAALTAAENKARDDNKRLADCLVAQETILKHGGVPTGPCQ